MNNKIDHSRRRFLRSTACLTAAALTANLFPKNTFALNAAKKTVPVSGHLWVYASRYPPNWDCTPILREVFSDFKYAGLQGVELMESNLRHEDAVPRMLGLVQEFSMPITGTSYNADMWDRQKQQQILDDVELVVERLHKLGGSTFGISVGDAERIKTEPELDAQAELLKKIRAVCEKNKVQANLHNHTYEVKNNLHDLRGTLARIPDFKLGPDLNWLVRGGVDPVWFIDTYGKQMVYMHIRDQRADGVWTEAVGEGVIDFPAVATALKKAGFNGRAAIELAFDKPPVNAVRDNWKKSREYVKQTFGW